MQLDEKKAEIQPVGMGPESQFIYSPDGKSYAYDGENPYTGDSYHLLVETAGKRHSISQQKASEGFSWTPQNQLLYLAFPTEPDLTKNHGYPNVYENDLMGHQTLLKEGGYRPLLNPTGEFLAYVGPDTTGASGQNGEEALRFHPATVGYVAVYVQRLKDQKEFYALKIREDYPKLVWGKNNLFIIESFYIYNRKTAVCRIHKFDTETMKESLLCG